MADREPNLPVAVFDSGVGGLTVLHECLVSLPHEDFLYLGDTARFPYGDRSPEQLLAFARELAGILLDAGRQAARGGLQLGHRRRAAALRAELAGQVPVVGVVHAGVAARRRGHAQRAGRADRHAGHRRAAAPTRGRSPRPRRRRSCTRSPAPSSRR